MDKTQLAAWQWLKMIGIEYYFLAEKDSKKIFQQQLTAVNNHAPSEKKAPLSTDIFAQNQSKNNQMSPVSKDINKAHNPVSQARELADKATNLAELKKYVLNFDGCKLKDFANSTVFGDGDQKADILLVGEAPGASEDQEGIPFCGVSGKLLDTMLANVNITRQNNAYITNTVFWRPPANRRPTPEEIAMCQPFVEKHIALIQPKLIILVGGTATTALLGNSAGISMLRNKNYYYENQYLTAPILTTAIFHPAYLLRQPSQKKTTWFDLLRIREIVDNNFVV